METAGLHHGLELVCFAYNFGPEASDVQSGLRAAVEVYD